MLFNTNNCSQYSREKSININHQVFKINKVKKTNGVKG